MILFSGNSNVKYRSKIFLFIKAFGDDSKVLDIWNKNLKQKRTAISDTHLEKSQIRVAHIACRKIAKNEKNQNRLGFIMLYRKTLQSAHITVLRFYVLIFSSSNLKGKESNFMNKFGTSIWKYVYIYVTCWYVGFIAFYRLNVKRLAIRRFDICDDM